ncbi:restriction endonuclease subunit S [Azoarcus sp. L1K30]|uniref:restriction endonuclease subunit S n=1 Tax=Azoarcus sp. L1K30 TaxID=2820277 RepID=UPI001B844A34|nr:restriction endonuclease subunit S [Azoarcus sp. L1K30]MBR0567625.1 restriction endonuclease subunit S [Azoarcus sp. L1K30]
MKFLGDTILGLTYSPEEITDEASGTLVLRANNIQDRRLVADDPVYVCADAPEKLKLRSGDILICSRNGSRRLIGKCGRVTTEFVGCYFGAFNTVFRTQASDYLFYVLNSSLFEFQSGSYLTSTINQLTVAALNSFVVPVPSPEEQKKIADFLDWKTGQIDALIAKKQALIEKLKEKRLAVITQAVTKGLDPDIPMYDSKVSWLGKVPVGWTVKKLKYIATVRYGLGEPPEYVDEGLNLVRATDISKGSIATDGFKKVRAEDVPWERNPKLRAGEIIVVRSGAYTGDSAIVPTDLEGSIAGFDMVVTATEISSKILAWALLSPYLLEAQIYQTRMRAAQPHLNAEELGNFLVIVPAPSEQESIALFIENETARIDRLMDKTRLAITRLTEYRTALITAATTGQIDVRKVAIPAQA